VHFIMDIAGNKNGQRLLLAVLHALFGT